MRIPLVFIMCTMTFLLNSCAQDEKKLGKAVSGTNQVNSGFENWWTYHSNKIKFYKDFTPFDAHDNVVPLDTFMKQYSTGEYIVLKYMGGNSEVQYKLEKLDKNANEEIKNTLRSIAYTDYQDYLRLGKPLPDFNFTDLNGNQFDSLNTKGKYVIMKFWFIGCVPCVTEMPELNKLVAEHSNRKDMLFLSLAFDSDQALRTFLVKKQFDYKVVGNKKAYLNETLNVRAYPTHLVINKEGQVDRICNSAVGLKSILSEKEYNL